MSSAILTEDPVIFYDGERSIPTGKRSTPWRFAAYTGLAVFSCCFGWELSRQLFTPPALTVAPTTRLPMVVYAASPEKPVDEDAVAQAAVAGAAAEERQVSTSTKGFYLGQNSWYPTEAETLAANKKWYVIDAANLRLGRMCTEIARILRGKNKGDFHPAMDTGDFVIVVNAEKVVVSGKKPKQKTYFRHVTGRPGSWKIETFEELQKRIPERIVQQAVKGMLPKGPLGRQQYTHLKVYKGPAHPHAAQQPIEVKFEGALSRAAEPLTRR